MTSEVIDKLINWRLDWEANLPQQASFHQAPTEGGLNVEHVGAVLRGQSIDGRCQAPVEEMQLAPPELAPHEPLHELSRDEFASSPLWKEEELRNNGCSGTVSPQRASASLSRTSSRQTWLPEPVPAQGGLSGDQVDALLRGESLDSHCQERAEALVDVRHGVFNLVIRSVSGEDLLILSGAHANLTRGDIIRYLLEEVPPPLGQGYKLIHGQAVLAGEQTLGGCLLGDDDVSYHMGHPYLIAVVIANEAQLALAQALDSVMQQNLRDILEVAAFAKPPCLVDLTFKVLCELWCIQPAKVRLTDGSYSDGYWQIARSALLQDKGAGLLDRIREYNPDDNPRHAFDVLDQYVTGDSFVPSRVAACSRLCKALCEWCCALHAYCSFSIENGMA